MADDGDEGDDLVQAIAEAADVLTVTTRRLQGVRLGRKFSGGKATIEERKKRSNCSVCGQQGHWAGDAECSFSRPCWQNRWESQRQSELQGR